MTEATRSENVIEAAEERNLQRSLSNRHIQLIALGGAIGTGLFLGSGETISKAGPSILLVYAVIGFMLYFVMRAMGELLLHKLEYRSFQDFAADILGPWAGFFVGWTYWFSWVVIGMADVVAITGYWEYWLGEDWRWLAMVLTTAVMLALLVMNLASVKLFGEIEFWFAIVKLAAIVALVGVASFMVIVGFTSPDGTTASVSHLWSHGGMFPTKFTGFVNGFQLAVFAFVGIELVGTTAAETANPRVTLPRAINAIPVRILLFYVVALAAIMCVTPWNEINPKISPFVSLFGLAGLAGAAGIMNAVILSSASSSCNSGIYSTSRMLFGLAHKRMAPKGFRELTRVGVPWRGLVVTVCVICSAHFLTLSSGLQSAFKIVVALASVLFLFVWSIILICHVVYRRSDPEAHATSEYKMPGALFMPWAVLAFFVFILVALTRDRDTLTALAVTPLWFGVLGLGWWRVRGVARAAAETYGASGAHSAAEEDRKQPDDGKRSGSGKQPSGKRPDSEGGGK